MSANGGESESDEAFQKHLKIVLASGPVIGESSSAVLSDQTPPGMNAARTANTNQCYLWRENLVDTG